MSIKAILNELREYRRIHGTAYTVRRSLDKAVQRVFGTYHRQWKLQRPTEAELARQRANPPAAGLISLVIPVYNTRPSLLRALLDTIESQTYPDFEATGRTPGSCFVRRKSKTPASASCAGRKTGASPATPTRPRGWPGANTSPCATTTTC